MDKKKAAISRDKRRQKEIANRKRKCLYCNRLILLSGPAAKRHAFTKKAKCEFFEKKKNGYPDGRPTKFNQQIIDATKKYIEACKKDEVEEFHKTRGEKSDTYDRILDIKLPTKLGLRMELNISKDTLIAWIEEKPEFSELISDLMEIQEERLKFGGLSGQYNSTITKLLLGHHHGIVEKKELSGPGGKSLFGDLLDELDENNK